MIAQLEKSSAHEMSGLQAVVFDIQRCCTHDGPGIRTTVFLKGCPLRCAWCHNPESQSPDPEPMTSRKPCGGGENLRMVGRPMSVEMVLTKVLRDRDYYEASGGGLTVSGGEPMSSFSFTQALLRSAKVIGMHTCLDTSGAANPKQYEAIAPDVDLFLYDIKLSDRELSREMVGASQDQLWAGLKRLDAMGSASILRCPIIPGINDTPLHFAVIARLANTLSHVQGIHVIPYHRLGIGKQEQLGRGNGFDARCPGTDQVRRWLASISAITPVPVSLG